MGKLFFLVVALFLSVNLAMAASIESEIREFAKREYPNDIQMQQYTYNEQIVAYSYLVKVKDSDVKEFALREYPTDYAMQKYIYDEQLAAKRYMQTVGDTEIKQFAVREYPYDYAMQKHTYNEQFSAKRYMGSVTNKGAKNKAIREYPFDYSMQKYTYDELASQSLDGLAVPLGDPMKISKIESCYEQGVRYGRCAYSIIRGEKCKPVDDIVISVGCRGSEETKKGITSGMAKEPKILVQEFCYALQAAGSCDNLRMRFDTESKIQRKVGGEFRGPSKPYNDDCFAGLMKAFDAENKGLCKIAWKKYGCNGTDEPRLIQENHFRTKNAKICEYR